MSEDGGQEGTTERVAAILAADAVGYSRLMADDEKATIAALDRARAVFTEHIEANRGRVVDTAGDSVLAVFQTTGGAVRASVAIQEGLAALGEGVPEPRQMLFRIGIHLGDIHEKADGTIYGDGVNVAARLEALSQPGGITVSDSVHGSIRDRLDVSFEFLGEHEGKNLRAPVKAYRVLPEGVALDTSKSKLGIPRSGVIAAAVAAILIVVGAVWWQTRAPELPPMVSAAGTPTDDPILAAPSGPAIAVLPFTDLSEAAGQAFFADGLAEDIITGLSRFNHLRVIARNSTFQYKGQAVDVREVGEALGVRYVLEGSVRRAGDSLRVSAQLLDARDGTHLWAETYARDLTTADIFGVQDSIMERIVGTLGDEHGVISRAGLAETAARHTDNLSAYECVLRAYGYYDVITPAEHLAVRACLEEAVALDLTYAEAWGWLSHMYQDEYKFGFNPRPDVGDPLASAIAASQNAIKADPTSQIGYESLATGHYFAGDLEQFRIAAERALSLNPNNSQTLAYLGQMIAFAGDWDRGIALMDKAVSLNPNHPTWYHAAYLMRHYRDADYAAALLSAKRYNLPIFFAHHLFHAIIYAQLGRTEEARASIVALEALYPGYADVARSNLEKWWKDEAVVTAMLDGLEKAGLFDEPEPPSRPVIAVLPFDNLSGDPEQDYFADGITEDIITRLAQFPDILVLGRNTTFQFKGEAVDVKEIGARLEADYIVEGSIRRAGETVRVNAQLLDTESGGHIWAETYDRALDPANLFAMQDEITEAVASRIGDRHGAIGRAEFQRSSRQAPKSLSSYECILRFVEFQRHFNEETHGVARACLEEVVEAEPDYGEAWALLGNAYLNEINFGFNASAESSLARAIEFMERGIAIDPGSGLAHVHLAWALLTNDNPERALREAEEALRLDPNNVEVIATAGIVFVNTGEYQRTEEIMAKVTLLNPNYPAWMNWNMAKVHLARGDYADVVARLEMTQMAWWYWTKAFLAAAHCANGDIERGQEELDAALQANPDLAEAYWPEVYYFNKRPEVQPMIDALSAGLEVCGWDVPPDPGRQAAAAPK